MSQAHTKSLEELMKQFTRLPGIGPRTAERLTYHILKTPAEEALKLAQAIKEVKTKIRRCSICFNLSEQDTCDICRDERRDHGVICVVEQANDLISLESTGLCGWVYHVLGGRIAPLEGVSPDDLTVDALVKRIKAGNVSEVILATNPNLDGDGTALYISSLLAEFPIKVTRLARGLPSGGSIEFAGKQILSDAIIHRTRLD